MRSSTTRRAVRAAAATGCSIALSAAIGLTVYSLAAAPVAEPLAAPPAVVTTPSTVPAPVTAAVAGDGDARPITPLVYVAEDGERITVARIRRFLEARRSPMATYARGIVRAGLEHGVDPRVVVAIAGVESSFGRAARGFNAWGWGRLRWASWPEAIDEFTRAVSAGYRSLRTGRFHRASRTYCPPCGDRWGVKTAAIFRRI